MSVSGLIGIDHDRLAAHADPPARAGIQRGRCFPGLDRVIVGKLEDQEVVALTADHTAIRIVAASGAYEPLPGCACCVIDPCRFVIEASQRRCRGRVLEILANLLPGCLADGDSRHVIASEGLFPGRWRDREGDASAQYQKQRRADQIDCRINESRAHVLAPRIWPHRTDFLNPQMAASCSACPR